MQMYRDSKIGIMGGTFNPIHYGHLVIAEFARARFNLEKVIFVPAKEPPHKEDRTIAPAECRYEMVKMAIASNPYFSLSREEIERTGMSYSVDTLKKFRLEYDNSDLYFIIGADAIAEIMTWKDVTQVMELCQFLAATRPNYPLEQLRRVISTLPYSFQGRVLTFEIPAIGISSTEIRNLIKKGCPIKYLVPERVEKYLVDNSLYL